jgi:hypothetical protein
MGDRVDAGDDRATGLPASEEAHIDRPDVLLPGLPRHVRSADHTVDDQLGRETMSPRSAHEQRTAQAFACPPAVAVAVAVIRLAAVLIALGVGDRASGVMIEAGVVTGAAVLVGPGSVVVQPNESQVLILFGRHVGTLSDAGLW